MGPRTGVDTMEKKKLFPPAGDQTLPVQPVAIPTELSRFLRSECGYLVTLSKLHQQQRLKVPKRASNSCNCFASVHFVET
jgi:hypothetical protein